MAKVTNTAGLLIPELGPQTVRVGRDVPWGVNQNLHFTHTARF